MSLFDQISESVKDYNDKIMTTTSNNEAIAKYMGDEPAKHWKIVLSYDKDWSALMPVVEKINSGSAYDYIEIDRKVVFLHRYEQKVMPFLFENHGGMKGAIYAAVVEFVTNLK